MWKADISTRVDENVTVPNSREDYPGAQHIAYVPLLGCHGYVSNIHHITLTETEGKQSAHKGLIAVCSGSFRW